MHQSGDAFRCQSELDGIEVDHRRVRIEHRLQIYQRQIHIGDDRYRCVGGGQPRPIDVDEITAAQNVFRQLLERFPRFAPIARVGEHRV